MNISRELCGRMSRAPLALKAPAKQRKIQRSRAQKCFESFGEASSMKNRKLLRVRELAMNFNISHFITKT